MRFLLFLAFFAAAPSSAEVVDRIIAVVNEEIITESELNSYRQKLKKGTIVDDLVVQNPQTLLKDRSALIEHLINEKVIDSEVKQKKISVSSEEVTKEIGTIAGRQGVTAAQMKRALTKDHGVDWAEYRDFVQTRLERQNLISIAVTSKVKISDEEVIAHYLSKKGGSARESFEYSLAHILFLPKDGDWAAAKDRGESVLKKLSNSGDFEALAARYSEDPAFSPGGSLGTFRTGESLPEIDQAVSTLSPGQITPLVKTRIGIHIIKVISKRPANDPEFDREKEQIRGYLYQRAFKKQFAFWLAQKRRGAFVRVNTK